MTEFTEKPAAVFFDLDGTLLDTAEDFRYLLNELRQEQALPPLCLDQVRPWVSEGSRCMISEGLAELQLDASALEKQRKTFLDRYAQHPARFSHLFPGMDHLLQQLQAAAIPWGIVTNKPSRYTSPLLAALRLEPATTVCPDGLIHTKPHPEGLLKAAAALGQDPSGCWYIGDHPRDIEAGLRAGMRTVAAAWGYIPATMHPQQWGAHYTVNEVANLWPLLFASGSSFYA